MRAVEESGVAFRTSLTKEQVVARHCYALTYEREYVQEWENQLKAGQWGHEIEEEDHDLKIT